MKLGIMGGTFDPVHNGHLAIAAEVRSRLVLDRVLFIPTGQPWLKTGTSVTSPGHRLAMVKLAIEGNAAYQISTMETDREGPTYTLDTLAHLWKRLGAGDSAYFIIGWDSLNSFPNWHEPARILQLCYLVAVPRPGYPRPDIDLLEQSVPGISERTVLLDEPLIDISATQIRQRVEKGETITGLVPESVERYIMENGLYTSAAR